MAKPVRFCVALTQLDNAKNPTLLRSFSKVASMSIAAFYRQYSRISFDTIASDCLFMTFTCLTGQHSVRFAIVVYVCAIDHSARYLHGNMDLCKNVNSKLIAKACMSSQQLPKPCSPSYHPDRSRRVAPRLHVPRISEKGIQHLQQQLTL